MGSHRKSVLIGAAVAMLAAPALAADLPPIIEPPIVPIEEISGWYLRGDIGYKRYNDPRVNYGNGAVYLDQEELDHTWMLGVGAGYQFNRYFRADLTADYEFAADFTSRNPCPSCYGTTTTTDVSKLTVWTFMLNGYVDLAHWYGFTPYVGAGFGFAYLEFDELTEKVGPGNAPIPGGTQWNFAANATVGASYDITEFLKIDANYRYLWLGDFQGDRDASGRRLEYDNLAAHEFRLGLRYMIY